MKSYPHLLMEDLQNLLVGAPLEHVTMRLEHLDRFPTGLGRLQIHIVSFRRTKVSRTLMRQDDEFDLVHEDVDSSVETLSDGVVQSHLESFLFSNDSVEEIFFVDVGSLPRSSS